MVPCDNEWVSVSPRMDLDLCNIDNDIILCITTLRGTNKFFFSIIVPIESFGWLRTRTSVDLSQVDAINAGVTISVHDCSTSSKERYQILFDLIIVYHFEKRFPVEL